MHLQRSASLRLQYSIKRKRNTHSRKVGNFIDPHGILSWKELEDRVDQCRFLARRDFESLLKATAIIFFPSYSQVHTLAPLAPPARATTFPSISICSLDSQWQSLVLEFLHFDNWCCIDTTWHRMPVTWVERYDDNKTHFPIFWVRFRWLCCVNSCKLWFKWGRLFLRIIKKYVNQCLGYVFVMKMSGSFQDEMLNDNMRCCGM